MMMSDDINLQFETCLRNIDYSTEFDNYVPSKFAISFVDFIRQVNGDRNLNETPKIHYKLLDDFIDNPYVIYVIFRGAAKTTILQYLVAYIVVFGEIPKFGKINYGIYVSDTLGNGVRTFKNNLEYMFENSDFLKKYVPTREILADRWYFKNIGGNETVFRGYGALSGIRGTREFGDRPQIALLDDLMSDEVASSEASIAKIDEVVSKAVPPALDITRHKIFWAGTPFNKKDPLYTTANSSWGKTVAYPVANTFPCEEEDFVGAWEDRFSYQSLMQIYNSLKAKGRIDSFYQEYMLRILSEEDRLILDSEILWYDHTSKIVDNMEDYNFYITTDFAVSEKEKADYTVIIVWAVSSNGDYYIVDGICKRQNINDTINDLFHLVREYRPILTGVEVTGQQKAFIALLESEMRRRGIFFTLASDKKTGEAGIRPTKNKLARFNNVLPLFKQGKIWLPKNLSTSRLLVELVDNLSSVTASGFKSVHDDAADCVSQLASMIISVPQQDTPISSGYTRRDSVYYNNDKSSSNKNMFVV